VTELQGRTFATWTLTSCMLCLICAKDPCNKSIYVATLLSFFIALLHFSLELMVYQTLGWWTALQPLTVATVSALWMGLGWNYYTRDALGLMPTLSEETTIQPGGTKDD